jgi:hypothetical protein
VASTVDTTYNHLQSITFVDCNWTFETAPELVKGEPDGYIGLPLVIDERSKMFEVVLSNVVEFKSVSEPGFFLDGEEKK